jgi:L-iditol 2-dehydrogenase
MLVAKYFSNDDIRIEDIPVPVIKSKECLIKVQSSGICGSDLMEWYRLGKVPLVLGHEVSGEIVEIGHEVTSFSVGDRVVATHHVPCLECRLCNHGHETMCKSLARTNFEPGGFSQFLRLPEINTRFGLFKIPDNVTFDAASFSEPLACVIRSHSKVKRHNDDIVAVVGSGISGCLHISYLKATGTKSILAVDVSDKRLEWAKYFGADFGTKKSSQISNILMEEAGRKADLVIITTGNPEAIKMGVESVAKGGHALLFAPTQPKVKVNIEINKLFWKRDLTLTTSYGASPRDIGDALEVISKGRVPVDDMITHKLHLDQIKEGFDLVGKADNSLKIIINPNQST